MTFFGTRTERSGRRSIGPNVEGVKLIEREGAKSKFELSQSQKSKSQKSNMECKAFDCNAIRV